MHKIYLQEIYINIFLEKIAVVFSYSQVPLKINAEVSSKILFSFGRPHIVISFYGSLHLIGLLIECIAVL